MVKFFFLLLFLFIKSSWCSSSQITVHIFGDSHASFSYSNDKMRLPKSEFFKFLTLDYKSVEFYIHHLGPKTIYGFSKKPIDLSCYNVKKNQIVVFCLGEIDIRCHILRQADLQNQTADNILNRLTDEYLSCILISISRIKPLCCVFQSITPPSDMGFNPDFPFYGSLKERIELTIKFNEKLKSLCASYNFEYLDIWELYVDSQGSLDVHKSDGGVHVNPLSNSTIKNLLIRQLETRGLFL